MKILLVYPEHPNTFWSFKHALKFISRKASFPPLGLLTVAAILPEKWEKKLVDMNTTSLSDKDIEWADYVFISAMTIQKESVRKVLSRCKENGVKTVLGGPLFRTEHEEFEAADHIILNEAEITLPTFLDDLEAGKPKHIYSSSQWAELKDTPAPLWSLINMKNYASMNIQYSRGCPFNCEFCDVTMLMGRKIRTKSKEQIVMELESLYSHGWRGEVFFVDDNFIGNKNKLKREVLPAIYEWQKKRKYPFSFITQSSVNLADDEELLKMMVKSGFDAVFVGIETPNENSLAECGKIQNRNRDLFACIEKIQRSGMQVQGGFILGFDSDPPSIFSRLIDFIQNTGIVVAMVGLLNAPKGTRLYQRMMSESRIIKLITGNNTDLSMNFLPKMNYQELIEGYKSVIKTIYSPKYYYKRVITFLKRLDPLPKKNFRFNIYHIEAFIKSIWYLGIKEKGRFQYWKLFFWSLFRHPRFFPLAITFAIYGYHFRRVFEIT